MLWDMFWWRIMTKIKMFHMKKGYKAGVEVMYPDSICICQTARQYKDPYKVLTGERDEKNKKINTKRM